MTRGQLPKAYLRIDPNIDQTHPDNLDDYLRLLCAANRQPCRGRFRDRLMLDYLFPKRVVLQFFKRGDLVMEEDGRIYVAGWDEWQEGDLTVGERMARLRNKPSHDRNEDRNSAVTEPSRERIPPSEASRRLGVKASDVLTHPDARDGLPNLTEAVVREAERITGQGILQAGERQRTELDRQCERHGELAVIAALRAVANGKQLSYRQLVWGAMKYLEPIPSAKEVAQADRDLDDQKRSDRIERQMHERRMRHFRFTGIWPEDWGPAPEGAA